MPGMTVEVARVGARRLGPNRSQINIRMKLSDTKIRAGLA
jgi:hypothetical protein